MKKELPIKVYADKLQDLENFAEGFSWDPQPDCVDLFSDKNILQQFLEFDDMSEGEGSELVLFNLDDKPTHPIEAAFMLECPKQTFNDVFEEYFNNSFEEIQDKLLPIVEAYYLLILQSDGSDFDVDSVTAQFKFSASKGKKFFKDMVHFFHKYHDFVELSKFGRYKGIATYRYNVNAKCFYEESVYIRDILPEIEKEQRRLQYLKLQKEFES